MFLFNDKLETIPIKLSKYLSPNVSKANKKWKGGQSGTYQRLMIGVVGSAGERRKDVEMKRKNIG